MIFKEYLKDTLALLNDALNTDAVHVCVHLMYVKATSTISALIYVTG